MTCENGEMLKKDISFGEKLKNGYDPMVEGVRWSERYARRIEHYWNYIPNWLAKILATIAVFLLASGIQGIWPVATYAKFVKYVIFVHSIFLFLLRRWKIIIDCYQFD